MKYSREEAFAHHSSAVDRFTATAAAIPAESWHDLRAGGKWSAALVTEHLIASWDIVLDELRGGEGMKIRTSFWQRLLLRLFLMPKLLSGAPFPEGARAPRETRPTGRTLDRDESLALFLEKAREFEGEAASAPAEKVVTHAYFGTAPVAEGVLICARHVEHHRHQLEEILATTGEGHDSPDGDVETA